MKFYYIIALFISIQSYSQNVSASTIDKKSTAKSTKIKPTFVTILSDSINETSGLLASDGLLWTHNDDSDTTLYGLDTLGRIQKKVVLQNVTNQDWEEISQDEDHIYIGDFGNNSSGNRTNLKILKIEKNSLYSSRQKIDTIHFTYQNQTDFSRHKLNTTNYDCEAFIVSNDSIYLFTKQWKNKKSSVYSLPTTAGQHVATFQTTINTNGLVTGATLGKDSKSIVLCGYSKKGKPFLYLLSHYKNNAFATGKQRKIKLKLPFHQVEGIATFDNRWFYFTNEKLVRKPILNVQQKLHKVDLSAYLD